MPIELTPKVEKIIGFISGGVYYFDLNGRDTLVIYDEEQQEVYRDSPFSNFYYVYGRGGQIQNIYTKE